MKTVLTAAAVVVNWHYFLYIFFFFFKSLANVFPVLCKVLFFATGMEEPAITQAAFNALGIIGSKK